MQHPPARPAVWNREPLPHVKKLVAVGAGKGGVGKSTVTVNLALALAAQGKRVGLLDADIYGPSVPRMLGLSHQPKPEIADGQMLPIEGHGVRAMSMEFLVGTQAAVLRAPMITKTLVQFLRGTRWGTENEPLDILLIDLPPGTGDVALSLAQNAPLEGAIIVTTPQDIAVADADKALQMFLKTEVPVLGVLENMSYFVDPSSKAHALFGEGGGQALAKKYDVPFLGKLPLDPSIGSCADKGESFLQHAPNSESAKLYVKLAGIIS